jgi:Flp pilus assembly protein protease CpaA
VVSPGDTLKFLVLMSLAGGVLTLIVLGWHRSSGARAVRRFRTASPSRSAVCDYSPNAFLTNLPDV